MATKILNAENKPANFDTGDKAVMMPQLGAWPIYPTAGTTADQNGRTGDAWMPPKTIKVVLFRSGGGFGDRSARAASQERENVR